MPDVRRHVPAPDGYQPFRELICELRSVNCVEAADALENAMSIGSVGSEVLGDLGLALMAHRDVLSKTPRIVQLVGECANEVRRAWPDFR
jgi:hypothetical protein